MRHAPFLLCLTLGLAPASWACIHGPSDYEGEFHQERQQALAVFHEGQQDLFLTPTVVFEGEAPPEIAWVIPVPSVPSHYAEANPAALKDLSQAFRQRTQPLVFRGAKGGADSMAESNSLELLEAKVAGNYTIQPIKAQGAEGAKALSGWLTANGFGAVPAANMRYYVERDWVWLCVKAKTQGTRNALAPLQISFATPRLVYPLKFSTHQGTFALELFAVTKAACPQLAQDAKAFGFVPAKERMSTPNADQPMLAKVNPYYETTTLTLPSSTAKALHRAKLSGDVVVTRFVHHGLKGDAIRGWTSDFSLTPAP